MTTILIAGTHQFRDDKKLEWYMPMSNFRKFLATQNVFVLDPQFVWSTSLGGVGFGNNDLIVWEAAGTNLFQFCVPPRCPDNRVPGAELNIICHSHGLQVVMYACAMGLKVNKLVSVMSPVRGDMELVSRLAKPNIAQWTHLHTGWTDIWQIAGQLFDGKIGIVRKHPLADENIDVSKAGHSKLLEEVAFFRPWVDKCILKGMCNETR